MGFFAEIASEARRGMTSSACQTAAPPAAPEPEPNPPAAIPETMVMQSALAPETAIAPAKAKQEPASPPEPPTIDLTAEAGAADDDAKRKAHEAAEAKRKAEFDAKQAEKKAARQAALDRIAAMNGAELLAAATDRVAADTERLTRRNMKEAVAEHIQAKCREDAAFAMLVMDPGKSMVNCFQYINRKAQEYAEQEMKDNGVQRTGVYGLDVPDGLCYQWAEDYFNDPDAKEDHKDDEKFVPKPYTPASANRKKAQGKTAKSKSEKEKPAEEKPKDTAGTLEQMSLM